MTRKKKTPTVESPNEAQLFENALSQVAQGGETAPAKPMLNPLVPLGLRDFFAEFDTQTSDFLSLTENELKKQGRAERYAHSEVQEYLTFLLGDETYGLSISKVREIIKPLPLTFVPRLPAHVSGILSLRGSIVPVMSLAEKLGLTSRANSRATRIVVLEDEEELFGVYVDEVFQVVRLPPRAIEPPPQWKGAVHGEMIRGVGRVNAQMIILLEFDALLNHLRAA